jgi:hypothetical protein
MTTAREPAMSLYVDRACPERWIVRDKDGRFWILPPEENAWAKREEFEPSEDADLEPIPSHYLYLLDLPRCTI